MMLLLWFILKILGLVVGLYVLYWVFLVVYAALAIPVNALLYKFEQALLRRKRIV